MRTRMINKLCVLTVVATIVSVAIPAGAIPITFDSGVDGWWTEADTGTSLTWDNSAGSDGNAGWIKVNSPHDYPDYAAASSGGVFQGDLAARFGNTIQINWYVKDLDGGGTYTDPLAFENPGGSYTYWKYSPGVAMPLDTWVNISTVFNVNWTDDEANAHNWRRTHGSLSFADECRGLSNVYFYGNGPTNLLDRFGIDTVQIAGVPEPGTLALSAAGLLGLLAYAWRKRR